MWCFIDPASLRFISDNRALYGLIQHIYPLGFSGRGI